ncbi:hypothetical protein IEQ34_015158 [Dendrobium chrysotoxum]|uniref:Uncharacterized protein n=1 Tax=Dendrobium chrysotoxum TaxID=161865 RepID=A0AAV7GM81_DENCH|nr:hypothetical protein IEQ34_015158 [Dendrobium chrysotoxum]
MGKKKQPNSPKSLHSNQSAKGRQKANMPQQEHHTKRHKGNRNNHHKESEQGAKGNRNRQPKGTGIGSQRELKTGSQGGRNWTQEKEPGGGNRRATERGKNLDKMGYIGHHGIAALHKYKYSGVDNSLVAKYILQPFWSRFVNIFPLWVP